MITITEFNEYVAQLQNHDWFYDYSDDHSVWRRGVDAQKLLISKAQQDSKYQAAFSQWLTSVVSSVGTKLERIAHREEMLDTLRNSINKGE